MRLSIANLITSLYTALVVFCVIGFMGHHTYMRCLDDDFTKLMELYPEKFNSLEHLKQNIDLDEYKDWMKHNFHLTEFSLMANESSYCDYEKILVSVCLTTFIRPTKNNHYFFSLLKVQVLLLSYSQKLSSNFHSHLFGLYYSS